MQIPNVEEDIDILSPEQETLYQQQFEEGYNLSIDPVYNHWLKKKHLQPSHSKPSVESVVDTGHVDTSIEYFDPTLCTGSYRFC